MQIDQTTLNDLSIFNSNEEESIFQFFNYTHTIGGKYELQNLMCKPLQSVTEIANKQNTLKYLQDNKTGISTSISNGTLMVMEKFYDSQINSYPNHLNTANAQAYKLFSKSDFSLTKYSLQHFLTFIKGMQQLSTAFENCSIPNVKLWKEKIDIHLSNSWVNEFVKINKIENTFSKAILFFALKIRKNFKQDCFALIDVYCSIDAHCSIATACKKNNFNFPKFIESNEPIISATHLYHLLLPQAVAYDVNLNKTENFLFLTGANMAGKSTFIKAIGVMVYLAHLGFPVAAKQIELSFFEGLLSNINIVDNIFKSESYFFNEVKRIKSTIEKINNNKKWLILIDELFKGTNIEDAMKCSTAVISGLQKKQNAVYVLSTHLYEIGTNLQQHKNIQFKYFETNVINNELQFSYQLKDGISNDKLGYLILEKEGVVKLLNEI